MTVLIRCPIFSILLTGSFVFAFVFPSQTGPKVFKDISKEKSHNLINLILFFLKEKRRAYIILISVSINSSKKELVKNIREQKRKKKKEITL